jgi:hypothetical protein
MLIANQSGWELRNPCAFTATWFDQDGVDVLIQPDKHDADQLLPVSHFGNGILSWRLPILFRTPEGYSLLARGPANYPKDAISPLEGIVETDWASQSFSMSWKLTRKLMPVRFEVDEPICMIVPQRRAEICSASMSPFFAHAVWPSRPSRLRGSPRASEWSGKATTRGADTSTARPGHRITRRAAIFVHSLSHNMRSRNRTAWLSGAVTT